MSVTSVTPVAVGVAALAAASHPSATRRCHPSTGCRESGVPRLVLSFGKVIGFY
jgi:hypothetical protein